VQDIAINVVTRSQVPLLHGALMRLSADLGDDHTATTAQLEDEGFGPCPAYRALLALHGDAPLGVLVCSPIFSTTRGGRGLYVTDLWVSPSARGRSLGTRLLTTAAQLWHAQFLKLAVYTDNPAAQRFYDRIGFTAQTGETAMILHGAALLRLKGSP